MTICLLNNFILVLLLTKCVCAQLFHNISSIIQENIPEDGRLNFMELCVKYGRNCEEYDVTTEDGYILKLFRLKGDVTRPIFLMHGLFDSADTFLLRAETSAGITLAEADYDVWVGNCRGNKYARKHITLNPDKDKKLFWNFSFHEFGVYDAPAMIDFILNATGQAKVPVIGHSQGNLVFYVLGAERPEYNDKIKILIALNPICHLNHVKELAKGLVLVWPIISPLLRLLGVEEIFHAGSLMNNITKVICTQSFGYDLCAKGITFPVVGSHPEELEQEFFPVIIGHFLAGTSRKDADHQYQLAVKKKFSHFDYGVFGNLVKYGSIKPPSYNLSKISMPVAMIAAVNDNIATVEDVEVLRGELPNVVHYQLMEDKPYNHVDFVWGKNMKEYLYPTLINLLKKYAP